MLLGLALTNHNRLEPGTVYQFQYVYNDLSSDIDIFFKDTEDAYIFINVLSFKLHELVKFFSEGKKLLPKEKTFDVSVIYLSVSAMTFDVFRIVTRNSYGDETRIALSNIQFKLNLDDSMFSFQIPKGVEVLQLDE